MTAHITTRKRLRYLLRAIALAALMVATTRSIDAQPSSHPTAEWTWQGVPRPGGTVEIDLVRGSVRAETIEGPDATIILVRRGERSNPATVQLAVDTIGALVHIEDRYPAVDVTTPHHDCLPPVNDRGDFWHSDVRVDAVIRLPADVRLVVHLMDGDIDVRSVSGPRDVGTNQGMVRGAPTKPSPTPPVRTPVVSGARVDRAPHGTRAGGSNGNVTRTNLARRPSPRRGPARPPARRTRHRR